METLLASLAQAYYPNPKDEKYDSWEKISVDYTFARGATEVIKQFIEIMRQQESIYQKMIDKQEGKDVSQRRIGN